MECLLPPVLRLVWLAGLLVPATACLALPPTRAPVLQVGGDDFPTLIVHVPVLDAAGLPTPLSCAQIRVKRVDELDPRWKKATGRIHLACDDLTAESAGLDMVATQATAYLLPGTVQFSGIAVAEVRLMHSERWSDRQYLLDRPYAGIQTLIVQHLQARCRARQDEPELLGSMPCEPRQEAAGMYLQTSEQSGIWVYPDPDSPARTVYAEVWSD